MGNGGGTVKKTPFNKNRHKMDMAWVPDVMRNQELEKVL